jgi:hypothetical protein
MKNEIQKEIRNAMVFLPVLLTLFIIGLNDPININKDYPPELVFAFWLTIWSPVTFIFFLIVMIPMVVYYNFWISIIFGSISANIGYLLYYFVFKYKTNLPQGSELDED